MKKNKQYIVFLTIVLGVLLNIHLSLGQNCQLLNTFLKNWDNDKRVYRQVVDSLEENYKWGSFTSIIKERLSKYMTYEMADSLLKNTSQDTSGRQLIWWRCDSKKISIITKRKAQKNISRNTKMSNRKFFHKSSESKIFYYIAKPIIYRDLAIIQGKAFIASNNFCVKLMLFKHVGEEWIFLEELLASCS